MSAFEDDVEPMEDMPSVGASGRGKQRERQQSATLGKHGRAESPEPDEELDTTDGKHTMWLVKVPRFLLQGWMKVDEEDRRLGTVRVYDPDHNGKQRMELLLPPHPEPAFPLPPSHPYLQTNYPRRYEMRLTAEQGEARAKNLYAFRERMEGGEDDDEDLSSDEESLSALGSSKGKEKRDEDGKTRGRRVVSMVGTIANEAALKPQMTNPVLPRAGAKSSTSITPEYREVLRKRHLEASQPKRSVKVLDESDISRRNMLTSGVGMGFVKGGSKTSLIAQKANNKKTNSSEKFARMPKNELLDMLFELFEEFPYWAIKGLRAKVQQPEAYLREVLMEIADYHRVGPYASLWSLKATFTAMRKREEQETKGGPSGSNSNDTKQASTE